MHGTYPERVTCNLSSEDHARLSAAAADAGVPLAPFIRDSALANLELRCPVPPKLDDLLARLIGETRRVGNNVNQVAAKVNSTCRASKEDIDRVKAGLTKLEEVTRILRVVIHNLTAE